MAGERRRRAPSARGLVFVAILAAGLWSAVHLDLTPGALVPGEGGLRIAGRFLAAAFRPALSYEGEGVPEDAAPLPRKALEAARTTVVFAAAATSLSVLAGLVLAFFASTVWWAGEPARGAGRIARLLRRGLTLALYGAARLFIALLRSVHELLWAVLFLAGFGFSPLGAVLAIAIPYAGTLAKVFSEMIDEAPRDAADALRVLGASPLQVFLFGLLPRAAPDMGAYALYRFECALRSSAVMGFFGFPTLGYYIAASSENFHFREVWTYLYTLFLLVVAVDWWSGALRRRFVA